MYDLLNYTEIMIDNNIESVLEKYTDICKCEKCRLDIKAIALNSLLPRYVVTQIGQIYKKLDELDDQMKVDVIRALTYAVEKVKCSPRHDD